MFGNSLKDLDKTLIAKLVAFHIFIIALSNWLITFKFTVFDHTLAYAAFSYPLVVVATDLTVRLIGKEVGRAVVGFAFLPAIIISIFMVLWTGAPLSVAVRIGLGSGTAYCVSTLLDVYVFQYFRERYTAWWIAPMLSSVAATVIDTYAFFGTAFAGGQDEFMAANWFAVATNHIVTKIAVSLLVILPAYGVLLSFIQNKVLRTRS